MWSISLTGAVAKEFFEKSKLHVHELSKIWLVWKTVYLSYILDTVTCHEIYYFIYFEEN